MPRLRTPGDGLHDEAGNALDGEAGEPADPPAPLEIDALPIQPI